MTTKQSAAEVVQFTVSLPPKELSPNARAHWRAKNAAKQAYAEEVWIARREQQDDPCCDLARESGFWHFQECIEGSMPWRWAAVHLIKHSTHETDQDNIISACKVLIDCCSTKGTRPLGIFEDDKRVSVTAEWKRERVRSKGRIEVIVTRRDDP